MDPSNIVTLITLFCFALGWLAFLLSSYIIAPLILLGVTFVFPKFDHLTKIELLKCTITMFIFGFIDCYYYENLWYTDSKETYFNSFGIFIWLSTIRYYS